jgi:hypothetical protein
LGFDAKLFVKAVMQTRIAGFLVEMGLAMPFICTPEALLGEDDESLLLDPIVDEIHATRQAHAAKFGFDIRRIIADLKVGEHPRTEQGWPLVRAAVARNRDESAQLVAAHAD